jgi:hypothetical protein
MFLFSFQFCDVAQMAISLFIYIFVVNFHIVMTKKTT